MSGRLGLPAAGWINSAARREHLHNLACVMGAERQVAGTVAAMVRLDPSRADRLLSRCNESHFGDLSSVLWGRNRDAGLIVRYCVQSSRLRTSERLGLGAGRGPGQGAA